MTEQEIAQADDAVEIRVVPVNGPTGPQAVVTERVVRSESLGKQLRHRYRFATDATGTWKVIAGTTLEEKLPADIERPDWHVADIDADV